ncbi:Alpha/Beta hydrolase protein [Aspergillus alliaceus]|uniref:Alpha/Beta hydrolase protein n=1 Tax=Petromyces alliaceus TaxID=209559 RepID=UPI0012A4248D|nr:Alpha/Beta hydrolase protein [Aspergillus alliaceus]KAB8227441.1 Alpha/Beta hydrolase protein [Aspergillus alliaceus]
MSLQVEPPLINIHDSAFMLGNSRMVSIPQIQDCLSRNWVVVVPNHCLCPGVNILEGPVEDCWGLLALVYEGILEEFLRDQGSTWVGVDVEKVMAFGTSSGGFLALSLGYDVSKPPKAILGFYGAVHFTHAFWTTPLPHVGEKLPSGSAPEFINQVYGEYPVLTDSSISLEGQAESGRAMGPDFWRPRDAFAFTQIANGLVLSACFPGRDVREIDLICHIGEGFPATCIVHGIEDQMVPISLSRELVKVLREKEVECEMVEVPGEDHTFAMEMEVGSRTWEVHRRLMSVEATGLKIKNSVHANMYTQYTPSPSQC